MDALTEIIEILTGERRAQCGYVDTLSNTWLKIYAEKLPEAELAESIDRMGESRIRALIHGMSSGYTLSMIRNAAIEVYERRFGQWAPF